ncbi:MAG TPA: AI-2E family transporter [Parachlamydiaceae bacterium]|nr:AI-2E family transporter [Parachlamydiaceae bacterium]
MWFNEPFFKYSVGTILVLLIILLVYNTAPFFSPLLWFVAAILLPILFATILYYILRPVVTLLDNWFPRYQSILLTYAAFAIIGTILTYFVVPFIYMEVQNISKEKIDVWKTTLAGFIENIKHYTYISNIPMIEDTINTYAPQVRDMIYSQSVNLISTLTNITIALILTPFVLFYFLKDGHLLTRFVLRYVPLQFQEEVIKILADIDSALEEFIQSQAIIALVVGTFIFFGYLIIGLPDALALSMFAIFFYVIPFLGTFLSLIPALFVAMSISFSMVWKTIAVVLVAHLLEANLLTPKIMSMKLKIHPLTIILLLVAAGSLYGIVGLFLVTPTYAITKVIVWNLYKISKLRYATAKAAREDQEKGAEDLPA